MKGSTGVWISLLCLGVGIIYYALQKRLIIVQLPSYATNSITEISSHATSKKNITIYYWAHGAFGHEATTVIVSENKVETLHYIVTSWLTILEQSGCLAKNVNLESVMLSASGNDAYISFDRTIFGKDESIFDKWMRTEGLLKTIRMAQIGIAQVHIFVHHQPITDAHLDFSQAWPTHGFIEN